jgi:hypothetical protein
MNYYQKPTLNFLLSQTAPDSLSVCIVCYPLSLLLPSLHPLPLQLSVLGKGKQLAGQGGQQQQGVGCRQYTGIENLESLGRQKVMHGLLVIIHNLWNTLTCMCCGLQYPLYWMGLFVSLVTWWFSSLTIYCYNFNK